MSTAIIISIYFAGFFVTLALEYRFFVGGSSSYCIDNDKEAAWGISLSWPISVPFIAVAFGLGFLVYCVDKTMSRIIK